MRYPERIILNTSETIAKFRGKVAQIFSPEELREEFVEHYVQDIFGCLHYADETQQRVPAYVVTQVGHWVKHSTEAKVDRFEAALYDLAAELKGTILAYGLYSRKGFMPYVVTELLGDDLVLDYTPEYLLAHQNQP